MGLVGHQFCAGRARTTARSAVAAPAEIPRRRRRHAVYYRDERGAEPVNEFIEGVPAKRAAKIDEYVEEYC